MSPTRDQIAQKAARIPAPPVAIEAFWDGDTDGWGVGLTMLYLDQGRHREHHLAFLRGDGGDIRLFSGAVPPWPEAVLAKQIGEELAARLGLPFFFPSPDHPEDHCPRWWEKDQGYPCSRCGILLLQRDPCPWRGVCYHCHLAQEKEKKDQYVDYRCTACGAHCLVLRSDGPKEVCSTCDLRRRLAQVPEADRQAIRAAAEGSELAGIETAQRLLGWSLYDAQFAVRALTDRI